MYIVYFNRQILTSVPLTLTAVTKAVPTLLGHSHVAVTVATLCPAMEEPAWIITSVPLTLTAVNRTVSTLLGFFAVPVTAATLWIATEELVPVNQILRRL